MVSVHASARKERRVEIRSPQRAGAIVRVCEMCRWYPKFCVACQLDERYNESRVSGYELQISCCTFNLTPSNKPTHLRFFTIVKKVAMSSWRWCRDSKLGRKGGNSKYVKRGKPFSVGLLIIFENVCHPLLQALNERRPRVAAGVPPASNSSP